MSGRVFQIISPLEKMFEYEHTSKFSVNAEMRDKLLDEIDGEEFSVNPIPGKYYSMIWRNFSKRAREEILKDMEKEYFELFHPEPERCSHRMFSEIKKFIITKPQLPDDG